MTQILSTISSPFPLIFFAILLFGCPKQPELVDIKETKPVSEPQQTESHFPTNPYEPDFVANELTEAENALLRTFPKKWRSLASRKAVKADLRKRDNLSLSSHGIPKSAKHIAFWSCNIPTLRVEIEPRKDAPLLTIEGRLESKRYRVLGIIMNGLEYAFTLKNSTDEKVIHLKFLASIKDDLTQGHWSGPGLGRRDDTLWVTEQATKGYPRLVVKEKCLPQARE